MEIRSKISSRDESRGELSVLESFLFETLASEDPELDPEIMLAAVQLVLRDVTPEDLQQMEQEYAKAIACELKRQGVSVKPGG